MKLTRTTGFLLAALLVLGVAGSAPAQTTFAGMNVEGSVEAGGRWYLTDEPKNKDRAKFEEYRDMSAGPMLQGLQLRFFTPDAGYTSEVVGSKWGREDQEFSLRAGRTGLWQFQFDWDQTPHVFSTTARTLEHEISRGVWAAPPISAITDFNGQATSRELHDVSVRWDTARLRFTLTPTTDLELNTSYTRTRKEGNRPFSMSFGTPGSNFLELLEPVEQTVHDFRVGGTLAREQWQLQFGYTLSAFENDLSRVRFDNPCAQAPVGCAAGEIAATQGSRGQSSLPPSNMAHTVNLGGGLNLPLRTRVTGNATYSVALQNADFLPHTINQTVAGDPDLRLPQKSLNGDVQTFNLSLSATSRPLPLPLTLMAKARVYSLEDNSDRISFPANVVSDRATVSRGVTVAERYSFARHNADLDARYQIVQPLAMTVGVGWERWNRGPHRDVRESDEYFAKLALDATPLEWLLARLTYKPSFKRDADYSRWKVDPGNGILFRKIDESERDRHKVDLLVQMTPLDTLSITPAAGYRWDDRIRSAFGLQFESNWSAGIDFAWTPFERLSFSTGYVHEVLDRNLKSRAASFNLSSNVNADWTTSMTDIFDTVYANAKAALIPKVLDWNFNVSYAASSGTRETRLSSANLTGAALAIPGTLPKRMPAADDELLMLTTALRYHFSPSWTASVFYTFEQFRKHDWRTDDLTPALPQLSGTTGSIWLGDDLRNYDAHIAGVTLTYNFK